MKRSSSGSDAVAPAGYATMMMMMMSVDDRWISKQLQFYIPLDQGWKNLRFLEKVFKF